MNLRESHDLNLNSTNAIDEAFDKLTPTERERLEPYRKRITDYASIVDVSQEMSNDTRQAALQLLLHAQKDGEESIGLSREHSNDSGTNRVLVRRLAPNDILPTTRIKEKSNAVWMGTFCLSSLTTYRELWSTHCGARKGVRFFEI